MGQRSGGFKARRAASAISRGSAMSGTISIVMPAYRAEAAIAGAVASVLAQTWPDWRLLVVSDDGVDYEAALAMAGLRDPRLRFLSSGGIGPGAANARNAGLAAIDTDYAAVLDADDRMAPQKLARLAAALAEHPIVTTGLDVTDVAGTRLRTVAAGGDRVLTAGDHKWVNFSMDSMLGWDRRRVDARYDSGLPNMNDLDFLLRLYRGHPSSFHLGAPLHQYVKQPASLSNGTGFTDRMIAAKTLLRERLASGYYGLPEPDAAGVDAFLAESLEAERAYPAALAARPGLLFEDHIEPMLRKVRPDQT